MFLYTLVADFYTLVFPVQIINSDERRADCCEDSGIQKELIRSSIKQLKSTWGWGVELQ